MLYLLSNTGEHLFSGTRRELKQYIRKNNLSNYKIRSKFPRGKKPDPSDWPPAIGEPILPPIEEEAFNQVFENND